ncbi:MAG: redoxin domain-containing protein [Bryobacterales bacterium]|nr:redoxin domain-containing protein [Bryobacterales bacterium]
MPCRCGIAPSGRAAGGSTSARASATRRRGLSEGPDGTRSTRWSGPPASGGAPGSCHEKSWSGSQYNWRQVIPLAIPVRAAVLFLCLILAACSTAPRGRSAASSVKPEAERKEAPDFSLKDGDGRTVKLSDYRGKVVLLNFWATWCGPCKLEIPWFTEFETNLKDRGFAVLGVSMDEDGWDVVKPFVARLGVNYRMLLGTDMVAQQYGGVDALPTSFLIDREGKIASTHVGLVSRRDYENDIQALLTTQ